MIELSIEEKDKEISDSASWQMPCCRQKYEKDGVRPCAGQAKGISRTAD